MADKTALLDAALEHFLGDMDDLEGSAVMSHSVEDCPDPLTCKDHGLPVIPSESIVGMRLSKSLKFPGWVIQ